MKKCLIALMLETDPNDQNAKIRQQAADLEQVDMESYCDKRPVMRKEQDNFSDIREKIVDWLDADGKECLELIGEGNPQKIVDFDDMDEFAAFLVDDLRIFPFDGELSFKEIHLHSCHSGHLVTTLGPAIKAAVGRNQKMCENLKKKKVRVKLVGDESRSYCTSKGKFVSLTDEAADVLDGKLKALKNKRMDEDVYDKILVQGQNPTQTREFVIDLAV